MPRSVNQKLKLLRLRDILWTETDEDHPMPLREIIERLDAEGIAAERKSLYDDFRTLYDYGVNVEQTSDHRYFIGQRTFELAELKTLVDIIGAARFLPEKKSRELARKLYRETSRYGAAELDRQVHTAHVKLSTSQTIYYTIDAIHAAIRDDRQIVFSYLRYDENKQLVAKKNGYTVSPWALLFEDENYYLIAYDTETGSIRHYRVDRMRRVRVTEEKRQGKALFKKIDFGTYERKTFGMFGGEEASVTLRCDGSIAGAIIDRFGEEVTFFPHPDGTFDVHVRVFLSPQFYGWLCGLGPAVRIMSPEKACKAYRGYLRKILNTK